MGFFVEALVGLLVGEFAGVTMGEKDFPLS